MERRHFLGWLALLPFVRRLPQQSMAPALAPAQPRFGAADESRDYHIVWDDRDRLPNLHDGYWIRRRRDDGCYEQVWIHM